MAPIHCQRLLFVACFGMLAGSIRAEVNLIGIGVLSGETSDLSGLTGKFSDGTPRNRLGGLGSALDYTGVGNRYIFASDRGPKDGAIDFPCRIHTMDITVSPESKTPVQLRLTSTTLLSNEKGKPFIGAFNAIDKSKPENSLRLDPEGIRAGRSGAFFVSDEYGPFLFEFDALGRLTKRFSLPAKFSPSHAGGKPEEELPPKNLKGRLPNRGMEGLAISPDGDKLFGILQSPLIQDGATNQEKQRVGHNIRILEVKKSTGKTREFVYPLASPENGISEILAINEREFLVLERDGKAGKEAKCKKVFHIDLSQATDVSAIGSLPAKQLPKGILSVSKVLFLDLLDKKFQLGGNNLPEKFEGLAFGPALSDGRHLLLISADNDFIATIPFSVFVFSFGKSDLPGLKSVQSSPD